MTGGFWNQNWWGCVKKDKNALFSNPPNVRSVPFEILSKLTKTYLSALAEWIARFAKLGRVKARSEASTSSTTPIA